MDKCLIENIQNKYLLEENCKSLEDYLLFLRHKKAYQFVSQYCRNKYVLDYGCGLGYGAALISTHANKVMGIDINKDAIDYCNKKHRLANLHFQQVDSNVFPLPFGDNLFDIVVSFQVIEHVSEVSKYLVEIKRLLKNEGSLFLTTINKSYRLLPFQRPWNPEHLREYNLRSLTKQLLSVFEKVKIMGVYGTDEINIIEHRRVRQSPLEVYTPLHKLKSLKPILPNIVLQVYRNFKKIVFRRENNIYLNLTSEPFNRYSFADFVVGDDIKKCLDFFVICYK